jgi:hypothetical protein
VVQPYRAHGVVCAAWEDRGRNTSERQPIYGTCSTDGNWIAFQRDPDPGEDEDWRLYVVRADGAGLRSLELAGEEPAWLGGGSSPDDDPPDPSGPDADTLHLPSLKREREE